MNKGFTLIELLASIIIIGLILVITIPSYIYIYNSTRETNYNNKIKTIKQEALKYSEHIKDDIKNDGCINVEISQLIKKGYLKSDYKTSDAIENPITKKEFEEKLSVCYCTSNNELKAFYLDSFDYTKSYIKGSEVRYNNKVYVSMTDYNYEEIIYDLGDAELERPPKETPYKWNNNGNVTSKCIGYYNEEIGLCVTSAGSLNSTYVINNFFRLIEC